MRPTPSATGTATWPSAEGCAALRYRIEACRNPRVLKTAARPNTPGGVLVPPAWQRDPQPLSVKRGGHLERIAVVALGPHDPHVDLPIEWELRIFVGHPNIVPDRRHAASADAATRCFAASALPPLGRRCASTHGGMAMTCAETVSRGVLDQWLAIVGLRVCPFREHGLLQS